MRNQVEIKITVNIDHPDPESMEMPFRLSWDFSALDGVSVYQADAVLQAIQKVYRKIQRSAQDQVTHDVTKACLNMTPEQKAMYLNTIKLQFKKDETSNPRPNRR